MNRTFHVTQQPPVTAWRELGKLLVQNRVGKEDKFVAGQILWRHGEPAVALHLITAGVVRVLASDTDDGDEMADLVIPGEMGNLADIGPEACGFGTGVALTGGRAIVADTARLRRHMARDPELAWMLLRQSAAQSTALRRRVVALSAGSVSARLARLLCWLSARMGIRDARGVFIPLRLTRRDLSGMVGCRVETTIRILGQWGRDGLLAIQREGIVLFRPDALRSQGHSDAASSGVNRDQGARFYTHILQEGQKPCESTA